MSLQHGHEHITMSLQNYDIIVYMVRCTGGKCAGCVREEMAARAERYTSACFWQAVSPRRCVSGPLGLSARITQRIALLRNSYYKPHTLALETSSFSARDRSFRLFLAVCARCRPRSSVLAVDGSSSPAAMAALSGLRGWALMVTL